MRQRGIGNMARCIQELERIYGIRNGGDRGNQYIKKEADSNNLSLPTQTDVRFLFLILRRFSRQVMVLYYPPFIMPLKTKINKNKQKGTNIVSTLKKR